MKKGLSKNKILFVFAVIGLIALLGVGVSYAYFVGGINVINPDNRNNSITTNTTTSVEMDMQGKYSPSNLMPGFKGVKEVIVRGIGKKDGDPVDAPIQITPDLGVFSGDVTWKLYKSSTAITCTSNIHTEGQLYDDATCNIPTDAELVLEGGAEKSYLNITVYPSTETKYYLLVEYANGGDQSSQMGQTFNIDIGLGGKVKDPIKDIIAQLDTSGKCPTVNDDGSVNVTGAEATDGYLCKAKDAYGDSYYYRGNVTNNYVKFADKYWRIVRINGDGTVRVIYDGTSAHANGESSEDRQIGTSKFNSSYNDNAYVGYMYGNRDGIVESSTQDSTISYTNTRTYYIAKEYSYDASTGKFSLVDPVAVLGSNIDATYINYYTFHRTSASFSDSHVYKIFSITAGSSSATIGYSNVTYGTTSKDKVQTNTNSSDIKAYLDTWYENNIKGTANEQYLADNVFCNDRSISSNKPSSNYNNLGYGTNVTAYRWYDGPWSSGGYNSNMRLTCPQKNDAFTVSDTTNGNGALTYPVGLLSADEIVLAGGWNVDNSGYYLYLGQSWWASSPGSFSGSYAYVRSVYSSGYANRANYVGNDYGVRPVFNLKAEVLAQGTGTAEDPFHISS